MFNINFNNGNSFDDFGLAIERRPIVPIPKRRINQIEVLGRNGSLTEDEGTYEDIEIPIDFALVDRENVYEKCRTIKNWLISNMLDNHLIMSDDTGYYYRVKSVKASDVDRFLIIVGRFTATFVCEPFTYSTSEESISITAPTSIFNPGSFESEPYMKISGTGNINLTINDKVIILTGVDSYIEMDSEIGDCYKGYTLLNNKMTGEFPKLQPGENTITWTGTVTNIEIDPKWRWI